MPLQPNSQDRLEAEAAKQVEQLRRLYREYVEGNQPPRQTGRKMGSLFRGWFSRPDPSAIESVHRDFLTGVETALNRLEECLRQMTDSHAQERHSYAKQAVFLVVGAKPSKAGSAFEWYLTVAEYHSAGLLAHLARKDLQRLYDSYIRSTPKHRMLPKQKELCKQMKAMLAC